MDVFLAFLMIFITGCASLIGVTLISVKEKTLDSILFYLVSFATGTMLASALYDLIPESIHHLEELISEGHELEESIPFLYVIIGFISFFVIERFIYWFHGHAHESDNKYVCHDSILGDIEIFDNRKQDIKNYTILNIIGDTIHNFLDGIVIMVSFLSGTLSGFIIAFAVLIHELPQEIGDFGILLYGGFSRKKAILTNFVSGMIAMIGGLFALILSDVVDLFNLFFLAFSGGGFIYIACAELLPDLLKEKNLKKSIIQTVIIISGVILVILIIESLPHV